MKLVKLGLLLAILANTGCSMEAASEEDLSTVSEAFTANQCAGASAVATFTGVYSWTSSTNYGGACNAVDELSGGSGLFMPYGSGASPADLPTNQTDCQATTLRSVFYKKISGAWVIQKDESHAGVWGPKPFGGMQCTVAETSFPPPGGGTDVRVATTLRRSNTGSLITYRFTTSFVKEPT